MVLCHKWDVKNDFAYVLQFFSLISEGLGSVTYLPTYVDNCRHLINHHLPHFVHVVIELPLIYLSENFVGARSYRLSFTKKVHSIFFLQKLFRFHIFGADKRFLKPRVIGQGPLGVKIFCSTQVELEHI